MKGHYFTFALLLVGCAGVSSVEFSKPTPEGAPLPTSHERYVGEMFEVGDIAFQVYPLNGQSKDVLLVPVPWVTSNAEVQSAPFVVGVVLKAKRSGLLFEPSHVEYWVSSSQRQHPTRLQGPFSCNSRKPPPDWVKVENSMFELSTSPTCMWLEFEVTRPAPSETFFVELAGIFAQEGSVELPALRFEQASRKETFALP